MEKKGNRTNVQNTSKGAVTDVKKSQDVANCSNKAWPRGGRRREPTGASLGTKGDASRKPIPQRSRIITDKRPKPRAYNPNASVSDRAEASRLEDECIAELGSVFVPGSKKQSLNHLLNFTYTTYGGESQNQKINRKSTSNRLTTKKHKFSKEQYLQANCQFVVNSSGSYGKFMKDPDALVDWSLIEQINIQMTEFPSCPICLYPPVAAKITKCGHIYCWSCILHYLSLSDKSTRSCPICFDSVRQQELKSVQVIPHSTFSVNDVITFKLMKRTKGSLVAYPFDAITKDDCLMSISESDVTDIHTKLLVANDLEILSIIENEYQELQKQLDIDKDSPECCFVNQAITLLEERRMKVLENTSLMSEFDHLKLGADGDNLNQSTAENKIYYFYQAADGQHIYLHAINAKMLEHTYGSLDLAPKTIVGRILEKEGGSMTEDLRSRLRYLFHLPLTCQFEVAEVALKYPTVSKETLECYNEQLEKRRKKRQRRAKEEKKREKLIVAEENRLMGRNPGGNQPNLHIESHKQFPTFESTLSVSSDGTLHSSENDDNLSTPPSSLGREHEYAGPSFAKMCAATTKQKTSWPVLKTVAPTPPIKVINVTGAKTRSSYSRYEKSGTREDLSDEEIESEFIPLPRSISLADAFDVAIHNGNKKKNKKKKK